jgi:Ca2+-transporting ATPase
MRRPPRAPRQHLFTRRLVLRSLLQGAGALAVSLAVYFGTLGWGLTEPDVRTLTFSTLIVTNLALIFASRSFTRPVLDDWRTPNLALWVLAGSALSVLAAVLFIPLLRELFRLAMPHPGDFLVVIVAGAVSLVWMELVKRVFRTTP